MQTSKQWFDYYQSNLKNERINWLQQPSITPQQTRTILKSLQAWQLGETSDGNNLIKACTKYAITIDDPFYVKAMQLFIKEEQKHGNNLGRYLDMIGQPRIEKNWGDSLFRKARHFNTNMESWTIAVIIVESAAQVFYQSLKDATNCALLKEICTDILIDEAPHIRFQQERLLNIFRSKTILGRYVAFYGYKYFWLFTSLVVWFAHRQLFKAGNNSFNKYWRKMGIKFEKTVGRLKTEINEAWYIKHAGIA